MPERLLADLYLTVKMMNMCNFVFVFFNTTEIKVAKVLLRNLTTDQIAKTVRTWELDYKGKRLFQQMKAS